MAIKYIREIGAFWKRQNRNWRVVVARQYFYRFFTQLTLEYNNIYVRGLGATPVQLGSVSSIGHTVNTIIAIPVGWLHDRYSLRKLHTFGVGLLVMVPLLYALALDWMMIIPAMLIAQLAMSFHCVYICDVCLESEDRATGKAFCEGLGSIPSLFAPPIAAFLITFFGGERITVEGIRPLYWIQFAALCGMFIFIVTQLKEILRVAANRKNSSFTADFREVFVRGMAVKRWIVFSAAGMFVTNMLMPFTFPFAHEIKGAEQFIIGGMATAGLLTRILFSTPLGILADRVGRKKLFYISALIVCASHLVLIFAPTPEVLIISGSLGGFDMILMLVVEGSMTPELVPSECIGRWRGILALFNGLVSIPAPILGGIVWETFGPSYVFLIAVAVILLVRFPLMTTIPETLKVKKG